MDAIHDTKNHSTHLRPQVFEACPQPQVILEHYAVRCEHDQYKRSQEVVSVYLDRLNVK